MIFLILIEGGAGNIIQLRGVLESWLYHREMCGRHPLWRAAMTLANEWRFAQGGGRKLDSNQVSQDGGLALW